MAQSWQQELKQHFARESSLSIAKKNGEQLNVWALLAHKVMPFPRDTLISNV